MGDVRPGSGHGCAPGSTHRSAAARGFGGIVRTGGRRRRAGPSVWTRLGGLGLALLTALALLLPHRPSEAEATTLGYAKALQGTTSTSSGAGNAIAVDGSNNVSVTGYFVGTFDFDPGSGETLRTSRGGGSSQDGYALRLYGNGGTVSAPTHINETGSDEGTAVAVDAAGNTYLTGYFSSGGNPQAYLIKLDANGATQWIRPYTGSGSAAGRGVAVNGDGSIVFVFGSFSGTIDFDPLTAQGNLTSLGSQDMFIAAVTSGGALIGAGQFGETGFAYGQGIVLDGSGNIYLTGYFTGTVDFDPGPGRTALTSGTGLNEAFAVKLDSDGNLVWVRRFGGTGSAQGWGIAADGAGNAYVAGQFSGTIDFNPGVAALPLTSNGTTDAFAVKLDPTGAFVWANRIGGAGIDVAAGIAADGDGNVYLAGRFTGSVAFDPSPGAQPLASNGSFDAFALKLDTTGAFVWVERFGGTGSDAANGIDVDGDGNVYAIGEFVGQLDFDPSPGVTVQLSSNTVNLANAGAFVVKLAQEAPPVNSLPAAPQSTVDYAPLVFSTARGNRISVSDPDNGSSPLRVEMIGAVGSTITLATTNGLSFAAGNGTRFLTLHGTSAALNAALDGLVYAPEVGGPNSAALQIRTRDLLIPGTGRLDDDTLAVTIFHRPVAANDAYSVNNGSTLTVAADAPNGLLANDTDADTPKASLTVGVVAPPLNGALNLQASGAFTYTPAASFAGTDSFTYRVTDPQTLASNIATVTITVGPVPCGPRPSVTVTTAVSGGVLTATVTATNANAPNNRISELQFGTLQNAQVTLNGNAISSGQVVPLGPNTTSQAFTVRRATAGQPTTVPLTVVDTCGSWPTLVGGGPGAGF